VVGNLRRRRNRRRRKEAREWQQRSSTRRGAVGDAVGLVVRVALSCQLGARSRPARVFA
jgi:hypothetical protein